MAIKELGYVVIETEKPEAWDDFLLNVAGVMKADNAQDDAAHYRIDDRPFRFRIEKGTQERLLAAAYELDSEAAFTAMAEKIAGAGRDVAMGSADEAAARSVDGFFRTTDPAGNGLEFYHGDSRDDVEFLSPTEVSGFVTGEMGMGHAVFSAPNFEEVHTFYRDIVGFHDTDLPAFQLMGPDAPPMHFAFMHADNGRHHSLAFAEGPVPPSGCVHLMLEMKDLLDVGRCHDRMRLAKIPESATLGKHANDEMTSFYMQTPSGFDLEIGCDGLVINPESWATTAHDKISEWGHVWAWQVAMQEAAEAEEAAA